jgi:gliding motility-associated protein GldM
MAGGGNESPRQKMINLMYLVLMAMLALNVSAEVLNAFKIIRDGINVSIVNIDLGIDRVMAGFQANMSIDPVKTKPAYDKALKAVEISNELDKFISQLEEEITVAAGGIDAELTGDVVERDNVDVPTRIMVDNVEAAPQGPILKAKINETRRALMGLVDPKDTATVKLVLQAKDGISQDGAPIEWEVSLFSGVPATGALTLLTTIRSDLRNSELEVLKYLQSSIYAADFKFDKLSAVVVAPSSYVLVGQPYTADVFLTATSSSMTPNVYVGGSKLPVDANGKAKYTATATSVGEKQWGGKIDVKKPTGEIESYTFKASYEVAAHSASVSADKMNVLYIGVDNPITISAAGIPSNKVRPTMTGGTLSGSNGKYIATVKTPGKATINVSADVNGKMMPMGSMEFRVKQVPPPTPKFANLTTGRVSASTLAAQPMVMAVLENFDFDLRFVVTKYTMTIIKKRSDPISESVTGAAVTPKLKQILGSLTSGDKVFIDDISVKDPAGTSRTLQTGIVLTVQ